MPRLAARDLSRLSALRDALATIKPSAPPALSWLLPELREWLGVRTTLAIGFKSGAGGPRVDSFLGSGMPRPGFPQFLDRAIERGNYRWTFDPARVETAQRNRAIPYAAQLRSATARSKVEHNTTLILGEDLDLTTQLRALICEGPSLLAFLGCYGRPPSKRDIRLLQGLVPPLQARLSLERQLRDGPLMEAALTEALEEVGAAAFLVGPSADIRHANSAARRLLERDRAGTVLALQEAVHGRPAALDLRLTRLSVKGLPVHHLAILRAAPGDAGTRAAMVASRWRLTPRQSEVLELLARGMANRTIASTLQCAEHTVENHVAALLDKAGVDSRSALVARFWTA